MVFLRRTREREKKPIITIAACNGRRARMRRIDYYPSPEAVAVINRLRAPRASGDASSVINMIIHEWATGSGVQEFNSNK
jgi:hypothetical protein